MTLSLGGLVRPVIRVMAAIVALVFGGVLALAAGANPLQVYYAMVTTALGTGFGLRATTALMSVLILTALSVVVSFKAAIWNIGQEGYLYMGAIAASGVALYTGLGIAGALVASILFGALWSLLVGVLKTQYKIDEIVTTITLNFVVVLLVNYLATGPWHGKNTSGAVTDTISGQVRLSVVGFDINGAIILSVVAAAAVYLVLKRSKLGFEISLVGGNPEAARYSGISIRRTTLAVFAVSGALAGLSGGILVTAVSFSLFSGISANYGWLGIAVGLLGGLDALASIPSALLFSVLIIGNVGSLATLNIPISFSQSIAAVMIMVFPIYPLLERRINRSRR